MASPFQRQALHRKLTYAALILVLFTAAYLWRAKEFRVFGYDIKGVEAQAYELAIREQSRGEVDLLSAIVRLSTMGLRGLATCWEWIKATDAQKKNQWNEVELHSRIVAKLQPHFITPWIFQSWNLAYNVSVESDRPNDKYFYISRGIGLLAEGERQNHDNPDIRWSIGFFTQHKICQSDETNVMRSLSQLSMVPPNERDPGRFRTKSGEINFKELEEFCKEHPQLTRRLREGMRRERRSEQSRQFRCERPEEFVQFLADNFHVPSLWIDSQPRPSEPGTWKPKQDKEKPLADRFPVLPPKHDEIVRPYQQPPDKTVLNDQSHLRDEDDAYQLARAWYSYAQEPLPAPGKLPTEDEPIVNRVYQRLPRHMMTIIFRASPAQAQRFTAERLAEEGWFDEEGWTIPDWFREAGDRFADGGPAVVGDGQAWGLRAWQTTERAWHAFGIANHLLTDNPAEERERQRLARDFTEKKRLESNLSLFVPSLREEELDPQTRREYQAWKFQQALNQGKRLVYFDVHYNRALVESTPEAVKARKTFFEALDAQRLKNDEPGALRKYQDPSGIPAWRKVLLSNKVFRSDSLTQEQTFEIQLRYIDLYSRLGGRTFKEQAKGMVLIPLQNPPGGGACPVGLANWVPRVLVNVDRKGDLVIVKDWDNPLLGGPFDGEDDEGQPLIGEVARRQVLQRFFPTMFTTPPPKMDAQAEPSATDNRVDKAP